MIKIEKVKRPLVVFVIGCITAVLTGCSAWNNHWESKILNEQAPICTEAAKYSLNELFFVETVSSQKFQVYHGLINACKMQLDKLTDVNQSSQAIRGE